MIRFNTYLRIYENWAAALFLIIALIMPRISAVVVEFIPGVQSMIVCTGDAFVTITLGPNGEPLEVEESADNTCTLSDTAEFTAPITPHWHELARSYLRPFSVQEHSQTARDTLARLEPSRAPPALI